MKQIQLTQGKFTFVDDEDFDFLSKNNWCAEERQKDKFYASRSIDNKNERRHIYMHRLLMQIPNDKQIDHIDGDGLNNQKNNLRIASIAENQRNRIVLAKNNTSGYKGVSWIKRAKKWGARIRIDRKLKHLGYFNHKKEAASAYNNAAVRLFGNFANLNML